MKLQVLYTEKEEGKQGNPETIAEKIAREYKCKSDKIPPAYPCDNERLVFIVFEKYGKLDKKLIAFCKDLSTFRAQNVALVAISNDGSTDCPELEEIFKANGVNVAGKKGLAIKKGLFSKAKASEEDKNAAFAFAKEVIGKYFETAAAL